MRRREVSGVVSTNDNGSLVRREALCFLPDLGGSGIGADGLGFTVLPTEDLSW